MAAPHVIVAYYSQHGHTRGLAERLAATLDARLEPIVSTEPERGVFGYLMQGWSAIRGGPGRIAPIAHDPRAADLVIVGSPVWANHVSTPARAYLERHGRACKAIALFVTLDGEQPDQALCDMAEACAKRPLARLAIDQTDLATAKAQTRIDDFTREIRAALRARTDVA